MHVYNVMNHYFFAFSYHTLSQFNRCIMCFFLFVLIVALCVILKKIIGLILMVKLVLIFTKGQTKHKMLK